MNKLLTSLRSPTLIIVLIITGIFIWYQWPTRAKDEPTPTVQVWLADNSISAKFEVEPESQNQQGMLADGRSYELSGYFNRHKGLSQMAAQIEFPDGYISEHKDAEIEKFIANDLEVLKGDLAARTDCQLANITGVRYIITNPDNQANTDTCIIVKDNFLIKFATGFKATQKILQRSDQFFLAIQAH